ncbi:MAG: hypothetical protein IPM42_19760 [Saprospiraceae bacterium]|nr:hypothetical protein [Saprospiraceae bacterium]
MNLTLISKFHDVMKYSMYNNKILCINNECFAIKDMSGTQLFMIESPKDGFSDIYINNDKILIRFSNEYRTFVVDPANFEIDELDGLIVYNFALHKDKVILLGKEKDEKVCNVFDFNQKSTLFRIADKASFVFYNEKYLIGYNGMFNGGILKCYNINSGEKLWEFDPTVLGNWYKEGEVKNYATAMVIGEFNSKLYVLYYPNIIIVFDINNGNELIRFNNMMPTFSYIISKGHNRIFGFTNYDFISIDLITHEICVFSIAENLIHHNVKNVKDRTDMNYTASHLFIIGEEVRDYSKPSVKEPHFIMAFNIETHEIDWKFQLPFCHENPTLYENYLLQKDCENILYVFEINKIK